MTRAPDNVTLRVQGLPLQTQFLVLAQIVAGQKPDKTFTVADVSRMFFDLGLPTASRPSNVAAALTTKKLLTRGSAKGVYKLTPLGNDHASSQVSAPEALTVEAEIAQSKAPVLGGAKLALIPPALAPPGITEPLRRFLAEHPFETNVFGMTRFPDAKAGTKDPVGKALSAVREECESRGLEFHLASDRAMTDDLWANVTAHMWASKYGVAIFENTVDRGLNHNLLIEVGAMLMTGRRCALLKDGSLDQLPTDLVGMIYKSVDLSSSSSIRTAVGDWVTNDLNIK